MVHIVLNHKAKFFYFSGRERNTKNELELK